MSTKNKPKDTEFDKLVQFEIKRLDETLDPKDHISSGDTELDKQDIENIYKQLDQGNYWAWCGIKVTATIPGLPEIEGTDYLGACSYRSEEEFKRDNYYEDMCANAKAELKEKLKHIQTKLNKYKGKI